MFHIDVESRYLHKDTLKAKQVFQARRLNKKEGAQGRKSVSANQRAALVSDPKEPNLMRSLTNVGAHIFLTNGLFIENKVPKCWIFFPYPTRTSPNLLK